METFDFPYFKYSVEYPEAGFRMELGNSYQYSASPTSPDQRLFYLYFDTMVFYPCTVFKTNIIPTALAVGDLWVNTGSVNQLLWSQEFSNSVWVKDESNGVIPTVTGNFAISPDGTTTADRIQFTRTNTGGVDYSSIYQEVSTTSAGVFSIWLKSNTGSNQHLVINTSSANAEVLVTPVWQRFSITTGVGTVYCELMLHDSYGTVKPLTADILAWQAQITPTSGPALDIKTTGAPVSTVGSNKPYRWDGTNWTLSNSNIHLNITKQPEINAGRLDAFYNFHKLHKKFIFNHPIYGEIAVRFNKPLVLPKGNTNGSGSIEPFELEFLEVPGGL